MIFSLTKCPYSIHYSEQNRLSAKKSRAKKKQKVQTMNKLLANLKEENKKLREYVDKKLGKAEVQTLLVQKRAEAKKQESKLATQNFVAALRNPANRIVDIETMDFLNQLHQNLVSGQRSWRKGGQQTKPLSQTTLISPYIQPLPWRETNWLSSNLAQDE